jgi:HK97 family phage major capsid protein
MRTRIPGVMRAVQSTAWAIVPEKLHAILDMLELRASGVAKSDAEIRAVMNARSTATRAPTVGGKIAVLPLYGVVCQRANVVSEYSGGTSTDQFAASFDAAMANAEVGAIVIDCDSPGGSVSGVAELAARVRAARGKGKPIVAVANALMASAAYWICAQADEIVASPSSLIGSIGVFTCHTDESAADERAGIKRTLISAGKFKTEGNSYEPLSDAARAAEQAMVDEFYNMFVAAVAAGRDVKASAVTNGFGEGRVLPARQAVAEGLADRVATLEQVLADLGAPSAGMNGKARRAEAQTPRRAAARLAASAGRDTVQAALEGGLTADLLALGFGLAAGTRRADDTTDDDPDDEEEEDLEQDDEDFVASADDSDDDEVEDDPADASADEEITGDPDADDDTEDTTARKGRKARRAKADTRRSRPRAGLAGAFTVTAGGGAVTHTRSPALNRPLAMEQSMPEANTAAQPGAAAIAAAVEAALEKREQVNAQIRALAGEHGLEATHQADVVAKAGGDMNAAAAHILSIKRQLASASPPIRVGADREAEKPFASFGDQLQAIVKSTRNPHAMDKRLLHVQSLQAAASGMGEATPSDGGFAIQTDFSTEILKRSYQTGQILSRVRTIPISEQANGLKINAVDETSRATGSRYGGIQAYWASEADTVAAKKPKLRQMQLELRKLFAVWYLTDELMQDTTAMGAVAQEAFSEEVTFMTEDAILNGTGNGQPLGIFQSGAILQVAKEGAQAAATVNVQNITKVYARLWARSLMNAVWFINQDVLPQLLQLQLGNWPVYLPPQGGFAVAPYGTLLGRPIVPIEYAATLGTPGDITLADLSQYLVIDKGGAQQAQSLHVRFLNDEMTFRITYRVDGQPVWNVPLTPKNGVNTLSPFVTIAAR